MMGWRAALYAAAFAGLAATTATAAGSIAIPTVAPLLLAAAAVATLAGAPGILRRRVWPLALLLFPVGAYLLARAQVPAPVDVHGAGGQLAFYLEQLRDGGRAYALDVFPLEVAAKADVRLLLSLVMYAAVWLAAFLALSLRKPLPAIVIMLVLLGFGFTTDASPRSVWATLAFFLLAGSMLVLSRSLQREHWRSSDVAAGATTAAIAAVLALSIVGATSVAAGRPLRDWHRWGAPVGTADLRFNWMQNYPGLLDRANDELVMRVRSAVASYWRANALANFDGVHWWAVASQDPPVEPARERGTYVYALPPGDLEPPGRVVTESFEVESTVTNDLFTGGWPSSVQIARRIDLRVGDARDLDVDPPLGPKLSYAVTAVVPQLEPTDLIERGRAYPADVRRYSDLPFPTQRELDDSPSPEVLWNATLSDTAANGEWLGLYRLNASIIDGATDPYRIAHAVEAYLRARYTYSLTPPATDYLSPYAAFLFKTRTGYCQHFAGAMAVLLRFNGIPARVAVGFITGEKVGDGTYVVTRNDAHAWVEAYFPGVGWVQFDPTPGRALPVVADAPTSGNDTASTGPSLPGTSATATPAGPTGPGGHDRNPTVGAADAPTTESSRGAGWILWVAAPAVVLVGWPVGRALLRRRGLRGGTPEARLRSSLALVYADLRDYGEEAPPSQTLDETARYLRERLDLDAGDLPARLQAVLFGGRAAKSEDLTDLADFRRRLRRRLREREGRTKALLAFYGLRAHGPDARPRLAPRRGVKGLSKDRRRKYA
jgi:transglutaminase-like putative cysteine protease